MTSSSDATAHAAVRSARTPAPSPGGTAPSGPVLLRPVLLLTGRLRTSARLGVLVALLLLPALVASWSFAQVMNEQVAFAASEEAGVQVVEPAVRALAQTAAGARVDLAPLTAAASAHPDVLTAEGLAAVQQAAAGAEASTPDGRAALAGALAALVTDVGNRSNLILDPDLDSFYVMDAVVVQLPRALLAITVTKPQQGMSATAGRAIRAGTLAATADAIASDIATAGDSTQAQGLADRLRPVEAAGAAVTALSAELSATGTGEPASAAAAAEALGAAAGPLADELDGLLDVRIDGVQARRDTRLLITVAALLLAVWFTLAVISGTRLDTRLTLAGVSAISTGDLHPRPTATGADELGDIGRAVEQARERLQLLLRSVADSTGQLRSASGALVEVSTGMRTSAQDSASQAGAVATAAIDVSDNVRAASAATAQMGGAINEIASSAGQAASIAGSAVEMADAANRTISRLAESSTEINGVARLIESIAAQTNLLALNATIEAARAGAAGAGFGVVAAQVKDLADQTARATAQVSQRVLAIQADAASAVQALTGMGRVTTSISEHQGAIAAAVEEQTATTAELARTLAQAAEGTSSIAATIAGVARSTSDTTTAAGRTEQAADDVSQVGDSLHTQLTRFSF